MKKLGSIEKPDDFILAIAGGAVVNGTWKGMPLIRYYFKELMHIYEIQNEEHKAILKKYEALIAAGADVSSIIYGEPGDYDNFYYLARTMSLQLQLLNILLESRQAQKLILEDNWYHAALMELHENVNKAKAKMDETENL